MLVIMRTLSHFSLFLSPITSTNSDPIVNALLPDSVWADVRAYEDNYSHSRLPPVKYMQDIHTHNKPTVSVSVNHKPSSTPSSAPSSARGPVRSYNYPQHTATTGNRAKQNTDTGVAAYKDSVIARFMVV